MAITDPNAVIANIYIPEGAGIATLGSSIPKEGLKRLKCTELDVKENNGGKGKSIWLTLEVIEGDGKGYSIYEYVNIPKPTDKALSVKFFKRMIASFGKVKLENLEKLVSKNESDLKAIKAGWMLGQECDSYYIPPAGEGERHNLTFLIAGEKAKVEAGEMKIERRGDSPSKGAGAGKGGGGSKVKADDLDGLDDDGDTGGNASANAAADDDLADLVD